MTLRIKIKIKNHSACQKCIFKKKKKNNLTFTVDNQPLLFLFFIQQQYFKFKKFQFYKILTTCIPTMEISTERGSFTKCI